MLAGKTPWLGSGPALLSLWRSGSSTTKRSAETRSPRGYQHGLIRPIRRLGAGTRTQNCERCSNQGLRKSTGILTTTGGRRGRREKGTVTFSTSLWGLNPGSGPGAGARAGTISTADEIQSDPQTQMSTMFAWAGFRLGISYEAELRCLRPEIRTSGTRVLCGCPVLRLRVGGAVGRSSCCLSLVAGIFDGS